MADVELQHTCRCTFWYGCHRYGVDRFTVKLMINGKTYKVKWNKLTVGESGKLSEVPPNVTKSIPEFIIFMFLTFYIYGHYEIPSKIKATKSNKKH